MHLFRADKQPGLLQHQELPLHQRSSTPRTVFLIVPHPRRSFSFHTVSGAFTPQLRHLPHNRFRRNAYGSVYSRFDGLNSFSSVNTDVFLSLVLPALLPQQFRFHTSPFFKVYMLPVGGSKAPHVRCLNGCSLSLPLSLTHCA